MRNPLIKRLPREFVGELGKYMVIFLLMTCTIGLVSGFLVADESMMKAYDDFDDIANLEDFRRYDRQCDRILEMWDGEIRDASSGIPEKERG